MLREPVFGSATVLAMACAGSGRMWSRLWNFGHKCQARRKATNTVRWVHQGFGAEWRTPSPVSQVVLARLQPTAALGTHSHQPGSLPEQQEIDPYRLVEDEISQMYDDIKKELWNGQKELWNIASYYFDGQGKAIRPLLCTLIARAVNYHLYGAERSEMTKKQREMVMITEMIHSASLVHDDVIDQSDFRRGKPSVNVLWDQRKVAMAGDYILAVSALMLSRLRNDDVTITVTQVLTDLVQGEFMQMGSKENENERFNHYLTKTYKKTASLMACTCKAIAILAGGDEAIREVSFQYGRNLGIAFQLVDDLLDFVSSTNTLGKPAAADLKLGLATAPVLFACEKFPELNPMIMRRFSEPGDVEKAFDFVHKSRGLEQTQFLAKQHCLEALRCAESLTESPYQKGLVVLNEMVLNRMK